MVTSNPNIYSCFHQSVRSYPDHRALYVDDTGFTYRELEKKIDRLVPALAGAENLFIGLFASKSWVAYVGILAILKAGKAYVPLSHSFPVTRNETIRETAKARLIIADHKNLPHVRELLKNSRDRLTVILPDTSSSYAEKIDSDPHRLIFREDMQPEGDQAGETPETVEIRPAAEYAYLLFTSGSTGVPKGVPVSHQNLGSYIDHVNSINDFHENDRFSQAFDLTFDPSIQDMFSAWSNGAALCCVPERYSFLPAKFIAEQKLTIWHSVPSIPRLMKTYGMISPRMFPDLRCSMFGGEPLHVDLANFWSRAAPNSVIENLYGPTEITITISQYRWDPRTGTPPKSHNGIISIGKIYPGHQFRLVHVNGSKKDPKKGELTVRGSQVVDSYFRNERETGKYFVKSDKSSGLRWYRTGDIMKIDGEGDLFYLSRKDSQVKIRGNRIELGEIKYTIESLTGPQTSILLPGSGKSGSAEQIILFLLQSVKQSDQEITRYCKSKLPACMIPHIIHRVKEFPLNRNGKIDNGKLKSIYREEQLRMNRTEFANILNSQGIM